MGMVPGGAPINGLGSLYLLPESHPSWTFHGHTHPDFLVYFLPPYTFWVTCMQRPWAGALFSPHWQPSVPQVQASRDIQQGWNIHLQLAASVSFLCSWNLRPLSQVCLLPPVSSGLSLWETLILPNPTKSNSSLLQAHLQSCWAFSFIHVDLSRILVHLLKSPSVSSWQFEQFRKHISLPVLILIYAFPAVWILSHEWTGSWCFHSSFILTLEWFLSVW